jgi:hypothetical protein
MRAYGNVAHTETSDRWVEVPVGGYGIEVPIDPRPVSAQVAAARLARQAERQAAAEAAAAAVAKPQRRPRSRETFSAASMSPVPGPARLVAAPAPPPPPAPAVVDVVEDLAVDGPVPCEATDCSAMVTAEFVRRTGQRIHPPCQARQQAAASTGSTTAHRPRELVGSLGRAS